MITVNFDKIKQDILGDKQSLFVEVFQDRKGFIEKIIKTPNCPMCDFGLVNLLKHEKAEEKFKQIYGNDIMIDPAPPTNLREPMFKPSTEVYYLTTEEYESKIKELTVGSNQNRIRFVSTFYNPKTDKVVVTIGYANFGGGAMIPS